MFLNPFRGEVEIDMQAMLSHRPYLILVCAFTGSIFVGMALVGCGSSSTATGGGTIDTSGEPTQESEDQTPPLAPVVFRAEGSDGRVTLDWRANPEEDLEGYNVYRSTSPFSDATSAIKLNNDGLIGRTSFTDGDVNNGTEYFYGVTAVGESGYESDLSDGMSATPQRERLPEGVYARGQVVYPDTTAVPNAYVYTDPSVQGTVTADSMGRFQFTEPFSEDEYTFTATTSIKPDDGMEGRTDLSTLDGNRIRKKIWIFVGTGKQSLNAISIDSVRANPGGPGLKRTGN